MGTRANRNFGDDPEIRGVHNFNPGGNDFGVIRQVDGHNPTATGADGSNIHVPSAGSPEWNDPISQHEPDSFD